MKYTRVVIQYEASMAARLPETFMLRLPEGFSEALEDAALAEGVSRPEFVRRALRGAVRKAGVMWPPYRDPLRKVMSPTPTEDLKREIARLEAKLNDSLAKYAPDDGPH